MKILDLIFPKKCVHCGSFGEYLCKNCSLKIKLIDNFICPMCERASFDGRAHPACKTRFSLDGLVSFFKFDGPIKDAIHRLKYRPWIGELASFMLNLTPPIKQNEFKDFVIIPVALHSTRERRRGFNQAGLLGKELALRLGLTFNDNLIKRVKNTKPQIELKGAERRENLKNAFAIYPNILISQYPNILLVDDVWTTGSTMRACANVLKRAGAKKVWAMTLAR